MRVGIAIGVVVLGLLIAVGGAIGIVSMRRAAPDDAFESMVTVEVPLAAGDIVTYRVASTSCETMVLSVEPDAHVLVRGCGGGLSPERVPVTALRLPRFPAANSPLAPTPGDVVLVATDGRYARAVITAITSPTTVRVRGIRVAPMAMGVDTNERAVERASLLLVQRPSPDAPRPWVAVGRTPLAADDVLTSSTPSGTPETVLVAETPGDDATDVRVYGFSRGEGSGDPIVVPRASLETRLLRPFDRVFEGSVVINPTPTGGRRVVVVREEPLDEVCVRDVGSPETTACRGLPKTGLLCVQCPPY